MYAQVGVVVECSVSMIIKGYIMAFQVPGKKYLKTNHFYLDSCLTYMQFMSAGLLTNVHEWETFLYIHYNSSTVYTNLNGGEQFHRLLVEQRSNC